ncbi:MAG TPA: M48 family metalloprotease [Amaricoccus sp.]|nr:M48 family metalloprotease [Amaricoccus sp.]
MKGSTAPRLDVRTPALLGCALASEPGRSLDARNPARRNRRRLLRPILAFAAAALAVALATPAPALTLIRVAEIEATLGRIAAPLLRAAALSPSSVNIYIVADRDPNAFVAGGQNVFVHTGLLTELDSLDQVRAVLAHEIGHLAGGHQTRRDQALQGVKGIAAIGMLGAAAAAVGGAPQAAIAIGAATGQAAQRSALAYGRAEEATADQMALGFLAAAGTDPHAMLDVLAHFRGQEALTGRYAEPYAQNHPMWGERLAMIEDRVARMAPGRPASDEDLYWYGRMVAKLDGFIDSPAQTLRRYPESDTSEAATLARAVAWHRRPDDARAGAAVATLIAARPDDPYYHDLAGQFLLEAGRAGAAAAEYREAVALAPKEPLILGGLGRALLNTGDPDDTAAARDALARSVAMDDADEGVLRDLALAEARLGNEGAAALATAQRFVLQGRFPDADRNARRAADLLPEGSPGWRRAEDLITITERVRKRARTRN